MDKRLKLSLNSDSELPLPTNNFSKQTPSSPRYSSHSTKDIYHM